MKNKFSYKLYRSLHDIIHPSISRENISKYEILLNDDLKPVKIYYPKKEISLDNIIIYIPDKIENDSVYNQLAKKTNNLVIVISYKKENYLNDCYKIIKYIYQNIEINDKNIAVMSDYNGVAIEQKIILESLKTKDFSIKKSILLEPIILEKTANNKNTLVITTNDSEMISSNIKKTSKYINDFIKGNNIATTEHIYSVINEFLNQI